MIDVKELTGAEAGLTTQRQIQIALKAIVDHGGLATSGELYEAIERNMPLGIDLSQQGRDSLRSLIGREAVNQGCVEPHDPTNPGWRVTVAGRSYLDSVQDALGTEEEEMLSDEKDVPVTAGSNVTVTRPFDPTNIQVTQRMMSIFQVMRKVEYGEIQLQPDFQRNVVWNQTRQSRLIESILLRIPLPAFYLDATRDDSWLVVDGLQRFTTLNRFVNKMKLPLTNLVLTNLEFLHDLEGKHFHDLPRNMQRSVEDTELNLYIIQPGTPPQVKFTIFSRVNTGGLVLTPQEIRHALFQGRATTFLAELAGLPEFLTATTGSISTLRMDDRECVLRFLAFHLTPYTQYGHSDQKDRSGRLIPPSLDGFLSETMEQLNSMNENQLAVLREAFRKAMSNAAVVFGSYAFRKIYQLNGRRSQVSKPLFEVWSVLLASHNLEMLERSQDGIINGFIRLMGEMEFNKAISLGTGSTRNVLTRFREVERLLEETVR